MPPIESSLFLLILWAAIGYGLGLKQNRVAQLAQAGQRDRL